MSFTFFDHAADIGVEVEAADLAGVFADAAAALVCTLSAPAALEAVDRVTVDLSSPELDLLLVDWLSELLFRFEIDGFLPVSTAPEVTEEGAGWRVRAEVPGELGAASRVPIKVLVKAITYHGLEVRRAGAGWRARLIFDI